jgi:hypothetical protein
VCPREKYIERKDIHFNRKIADILYVYNIPVRKYGNFNSNLKIQHVMQDVIRTIGE